MPSDLVFRFCSPNGIRTRVATLRERGTASIESRSVLFSQFRTVASSSPSAELGRIWVNSWAIGWATPHASRLSRTRLSNSTRCQARQGLGQNRHPISCD
jgi:hypothetical protein